jgi:hypothetical protein
MQTEILALLSVNHQNMTQNLFAVSELKRFKLYLKYNNATATMVAKALNIYRPNACRYKRYLEINGLLTTTHFGICKVTGKNAAYLSCRFGGDFAKSDFTFLQTSDLFNGQTDRVDFC